MRIFTLSIFMLFSYFTAIADNFFVLTNTDNGTGSLREAINSANSNGSASTDYIFFNIPDNSIVGRTITISSSFPELTSNIIIDGTTQPGIKIGVSDAKIRITNPTGVGVFYVFSLININNIEIYGIHFHEINVVINNNGNPSAQAIRLYNSTDVKIGAADKGNYFTKLGVAVTRAYLTYGGKGWTKNISFKGNIVNLTEDGINHLSGSNVLTLSLQNSINLELGGELPGEGNFITGVGEYAVLIETDTFKNINTGYLKIIGNKMGCNYTETAALYSGNINVQNNEFYGYTDTANITVKNNSFNCSNYAFSNLQRGFLRLYGKKGTLDIKNNKIGLLGNAQVGYFSIVSSGFSIGNCSNGIIGGEGPNDKNYIAGCNIVAIGVGDNRNIKISKNSIFCNSKGIAAFSTLVEIPKTKIFTLTDYTVSGTTAPNSTVEVFLTRQCMSQGCNNGEIYLGNTLADASGNWSYTSTTLLDGPVTATGTSSTGATGEFARPEFINTPLLIVNPVCGMSNGYVHGMQFVSGTRYYWVKNYTDTIFSLNLDNVGPGNYVFVVEQGRYCKVTYNLYLSDNSPVVLYQNAQIIHPSCGLNNGRILNVYAINSYTQVYWKDAANNIVSNTAALNNVGNGQYKFVALNTTYGCGDSTGYFILTNQSGPQLNFSNIQIQPSTCGNSNGSITGAIGTNVNGSPYIVWVNATTQQVVASGYNANNLAAGNYRLKFRDQSNCDTIFSPIYTVASVGIIAIDTSNKTVTAADCGTANGSITNIMVSGANTYQWINSTNQVVGTGLSLVNVPAGTYLLIANNTYGCQKKTDSIRITTRPFINLGTPLQGTLVSGTCNKTNGFVQINSFPSSSQYNFRWEAANQPGISIGNNLYLTGINAGTYYLFAKNMAGCEEKIYTANVPYLLPVVADASSIVKTGSTCNLPNGSITGLKSTPNTGTAPFSYLWLHNNVIAGNTQQLSTALPGNYTAIIKDANGCKDTLNNLVIPNMDISLANPNYKTVSIRSGTATSIVVSNLQIGLYSLYEDPNTFTAIQQNASGQFNTGVLQEDKTYYVEFSKGTCKSARVMAQVKVYNKTDIYVPTAFTPNRDGRNDLLRAVIYGPVKLDYFTVYNRFGIQVFITTEINDGWDGRYKNAMQQMGSYVWILQCKDLLTGQVIQKKGSSTLIR